MGEEHTLMMCQKVIDYHKEFGKYPSSSDKDINVKKLASWISGMRAAKQGKGTNIFYPSLQQLAEDAGLPSMFERIDFEGMALETCKQVIEYYQEFGKYPSKVDKDASIKKLGRWMSSIRNSKRGKGKNIFYPSLQQLAEETGLPNMFNKNCKDDLKEK